MGNGIFTKSYYGIVQGENFLRHIFLLIIRLYWGALLMVSGFGKWMHAHEIGEYFASLNIPYPQIAAYLVGTIEFLGGLSFVLGFGSRLFAILLSVIFFTAYATAHKEALANIFVSPSDFIKQDPFLYLFTTLVILCFGPGLFSIDYWMEKKIYGRGL